VREQHQRIQRNVEVMDQLITRLSELSQSAIATGDAPRVDGD
jgi:hypothetical protein